MKNGHHNFRRGLLALALAFALALGQTTTAFALNADNNTPPKENTTEGQEAPVEPVTASTVEEVLRAIDEAEAGDTIGISGEIRLPAGTTLGAERKAVALHRVTPEGRIFFESDGFTGSSVVRNITFDGKEILSSFPFVESNYDCTFTQCNFVNCFNSLPGGAFAVDSGTTMFVDCLFSNNEADSAGHIRINGGATTNIENCLFNQGEVTLKGGAIVNGGTCNITDSIISGNHAGQYGGGIWNTGTMTVERTKIHGNSADAGGADIGNEHWGTLTLLDDHAALTALYANEGLIPNEWTVETHAYQDGPDEMTDTWYTMTFAQPKPDPEPAPEPTPDPEPSPVPDPDNDDNDEPVSRPSSNSGSNHKPSTAKPAATVKRAVLTCGKAVLDPSKADYLLGYADGLLGQENAVTRAQIAQIIYRLLTPESRAEVQAQRTSFTDVQPDKWYYEAVCTLENAGVITGNSNHKFSPEAEVTWGEMISMFYRFVDHEPISHIITTHWARDAINTAIDFLWIDYTDQFKPDGFVTRSEVVAFVEGVLAWANAQ